MRIACVGGGPAGLYFALLAKLHDPGRDITVMERTSASSASGWGVTFGDDLLGELAGLDPESARRIAKAAFRWTGQLVDVPSGQVLDPGAAGYSISRRRLLEVLGERARALGIRIEFDREVVTQAELAWADLIVACDGVNSRIRQQAGCFGTDVIIGTNKYIWLGTDKVFDSFTYAFVGTDSGWIWAYAYAVDAESSTFIVECAPDTWRGLGLGVLRQDRGLPVLEKLFDRQLDGHRLFGPSRDATGRWLNFRTVTNQRWHDGRIVLAGDAAHTTHFTVGLGTKLAIEDVISLAGNLRRYDDTRMALRAYERQRRAAIRRPRSDARFSAEWFQNIARYVDLEPGEFAALLHSRRSPLLPLVSPRLYGRVHLVTETATMVRELRKQMAAGTKWLYGRPGSPLGGESAGIPSSMAEDRCE